MIRIFLGKPGGGKSYGALCDIREEIVEGRRTIVTNLSIDPGKLSAYIQKHYPKADFDPCTRFRLLTEEETKSFWLHPKPGMDIPAPSKAEELQGKFFVVQPEHCSTLFVIDEAHIHFDARCWAATGLSLTYFNSQHRKWDHECIFVTQFLDLLEKRVKGFAQEYVYFVNNGLEKFLTHFRLPSYFTVKSYSKPRTGAPGQDQHTAAKRYELDLELAACYDTSAGVGIPGRGKPENNKVKGWNIFWIIIPFIGVCSLFYFIPGLFTSFIVRMTSSSVYKKDEKPATSPVDPSRPQQAAPTQEQNKVMPAQELREPVFVRSVAVGRGEAIVTLTDGRVLTRGTGLDVITRDYVYTLTGERYQVRRGSGGGPAKPALP